MIRHDNSCHLRFLLTRDLIQTKAAETRQLRAERALKESQGVCISLLKAKDERIASLEARLENYHSENTSVHSTRLKVRMRLPLFCHIHKTEPTMRLVDACIYAE